MDLASQLLDVYVQHDHSQDTRKDEIHSTKYYVLNIPSTIHNDNGGKPTYLLGTGQALCALHPCHCNMINMTVAHCQ